MAGGRSRWLWGDANDGGCVALEFKEVKGQPAILFQTDER